MQITGFDLSGVPAIVFWPGSQPSSKLYLACFTQEKSAAKQIDLYKDRRSLKVSEQDKVHLRVCWRRI